MASTSVVTLNVGSELFQTTVATLSWAGTVSSLASLGPTPASAPHFLDRDSRLFALLLSFLHHGSLASSSPPSAALLSEARHFGVDAALLGSLSPAPAFSPLALWPSMLLPLAGRMALSAVAVSPSPHSAALFTVHGGVVTRFDAAAASSSIPDDSKQMETAFLDAVCNWNSEGPRGRNALLHVHLK
ncbi:hypothetical protein GUJ93_ZPchr0001g31062 [Zizania palustris]|uniref:Potassium channel tetramerisation-type BTB domain-containing protein n=1 Tax=Zizania palustris TaxID=103762 RepID=A0A8J5V598_ZIZPA|nr:hypothetical protein GUJ93_ZPchr0001g31062 [Zizania palustris]